MNHKIIILLTGLIVGIISYCFVTYNHYFIMGIHIYLLMSLGSFFGTFILKALLIEKPSIISIWLYLGAMTAIMGRIIYDISFWDKTSHNLFPFELILYTLIISPSAFLGSFLANLIPQKTK